MNSNSMFETFAVASNYPSIKKIGVFGSYARGEEDKDSDIDILIEYDENADDYIYEMGDFMDDVERHIPLRIDYVTLYGLMNSDDALFKERVLNDVKWLYDADRLGKK